MEKKETFAHELCDILVKQKVVSEAEGRALARAFKTSEKESFDDFLLEEGLVEEEPLLKALSIYFQVPPVDVTGYFFDTQLLRNFPKDFLLRNNIIPLEMEEDIMIVAASDPENSNLLPALGAYTSSDIQFRVGLARDIQDAIKEFYEKSLTDLSDDDEQSDEEREENTRYHELLETGEDDMDLTIKQEIDTDESE